jgi:toxin-antitoxin system PIN domain toxin
MRAPDANVLLYAVNSNAPQHKRSREWLEASLAGPETIAFSWQALLAFARIATKPVFPAPLTAGQAMDVIDGWLSFPCAAILNPGPQHMAILRELLSDGTAGDLVSDAHLAAMAIEAGAELYTFDRDFGRFPGLRWRTP